MTAPAAVNMCVGQKLSDYEQGPVTRLTLALFSAASNDHAEMHVDSEAARKAGFPDVFAHGMLCMAWLGQALRRWSSPGQLRHWSVRFIAITPLHANVYCFGEVTELFTEQGEPRARLKVGARTSEGVRTLEGEAIIALPVPDDTSTKLNEPST